MNVIFLDIDGVLNSNLFYHERHNRRMLTFQFWWWKLISWTKWIFNGFKYKSTSLIYTPKKQAALDKKYKNFDYRVARLKEETCAKKLRWMDETCQNINAKIVISSTWRSFFTVEEWNKAFKCLKLDHMEVVGVTGYDDSRIRGYEIQEWLDEHKEVKDYVIIDDDSDMLPTQMNNFFPTDNYCGLTPSTVYRIERHFRKESEYLNGASISKNYL